MFSLPRTKRLHLYFSVFAVNLLYLIAGETVTWTSPTIPKLIEPNDILILTKEQGGLITICTASGQVLGPFLNGFLIGKIGRKGTMYTALSMFTLHWLALGFALNLETILLARVISGAAVGITMTCVPVYIAEIAEDEIRSVLNSFTMTSRSIGYLICYSIGPFVPYKWLIIICMSIPMMMFGILIPVPESPYYLLANGRVNEAQQSLGWLRRTSPDKVKAEFEKIQTSVDQRKTRKTNCLQFFHSPANVRALQLCGAVRFSQEVNGITVFINVMETIILTSKVPISSEVGCIIVGATFLLSSFAGPTVVSLYGYKKPLIVSLSGIVVSLTILGCHFYLVDHGFKHEVLTVVPVACLIVHCVLYSGGVSSISFALVGEMFAPNVKRFGSSASSFVGFLMGDFTVIYYNELRALAGTSTVVWTFGLLTFLGTLFIVIFLPETSNMTLEEIQNTLNKPFVKIKKPNRYEINVIS
uniref:Major facilitator superfamily (MFS) profile domain-containing protein n=1 Tax=Clastoptera arizonana TaxID=38151 RepID=A0A1B6C6T8_9HEMI